MKSRYNELFDNITPPKSDEEMLRAVLSADRETASQSEPDASPRKLRFRKPTIIAAAVAAVSVGVTAAGAASGWNFPKLFEGFYNRISTEHAGYVDTGIENQASTVDLSEMGIDLDKTVDFGYGTVHFTGAIADSNVVMVMYDLTVKDEVLEEYYSKFSKEDGKELFINLDSSFLNPGCNFSDGLGYYLTIPDGTINNEAAGCSRTDAYYYQDGYLSKDMTIELKFDTFNINSSGRSWWELELEEPVTLSLPLEFMNTDRIAVSPNVEITHDNYRYFLEDVVITPLSIQWYTRRGEKTGNLPLRSEPLIYRFKDGTEVKNYGITETAEFNGSDPGREFHSALLEKPIDPSELASVTIGDYTINL